MKKVIKRYGGTNIISFNSEEMKVYCLSIGDIVDVKIKVVEKCSDGER